jgi:hypothetical protein
MNARWLAAALVAGGLAWTIGTTMMSTHAQEFPAPHLMDGVLRGVDRVGRDVSLRIHFRYPERDQVLLVAPPKVPSAYAGLVEPSWQQPCEFKTGNQVRVSELAGEAVTVQYRAAPPESPQATGGAGAQPWELCYVRLYFDLDQTWAGHAIGLSSGLVVHYARPLHLWIRGSADKSLVSYSEPARMEQAAAHFGQPRLAASARALANLRAEAGTATILVKVLPFHYDERSRPVGGGWGRFVITVYDDHGVGKPTRRLDFSAQELPQARSSGR